MTKEPLLTAVFPLDLTCPDCGRVTVMFTVALTDNDRVEVTVKCDCGRSVNFGSLPAQVTRSEEDEYDPDKCETCARCGSCATHDCGGCLTREEAREIGYSDEELDEHYGPEQ